MNSLEAANKTVEDLKSQILTAEGRLGKLVTSHALFYVIAFKNGISEQEFTSLLAIDKELIGEQGPIWKQVNELFNEYLTESEESNGTKFVSWSNETRLSNSYSVFALF